MILPRMHIDREGDFDNGMPGTHDNEITVISLTDGTAHAVTMDLYPACGMNPDGTCARAISGIAYLDGYVYYGGFYLGIFRAPVTGVIEGNPTWEMVATLDLEALEAK